MYIWTFEEKLRSVCGYQGAFPYWEWGLDCEDVEKSPLFDGSPTSLGENGERVNKTNPGGPGGGGGPAFPGGTGGGCVKKGPFSDYTVNFGPLTQEDPLAPNPRCLKRDLNTELCRGWTTLKNTTEVILESPNVELFQANVQGDFRYPESRHWGFSVHGGGHFIIGKCYTDHLPQPTFLETQLTCFPQPVTLVVTSTSRYVWDRHPKRVILRRY